MRFDELDAGRRYAGVRIGAREGLFIGRWLRHVRAAPACLRCTDAADQRVDPVAVALRVRKALEHDARCSFSGDGAVGIGIERSRRAGARIGANRVARQQRAQVAVQIHGSGERHVQFASPQRARGNFNRAQSGGVLAAHGMAGPADMEFPRDAAGDDAAQCAQCAVGGQRRACPFAEMRYPLLGARVARIEPRLARPLVRTLLHRPPKMKIGRAQIEPEPDEHPAARGREHGTTGVVESGLGHVEHEQLLRQHLGQFARRNMKAIDGNRKLIEVIAAKYALRRGSAVAPDRTNFLAAQTAPLGTLHRPIAGTRVEYAVPKRVQVGPATHMHCHADDRNGFGCLDAMRGMRLSRGARATQLLGQRLLDQQVRVDPAKAEAVDRRASRNIDAAALPRAAALEYGERAAVEPDFLRGVFEICDRRQRALLHREHGLDQSGAARRGQQMADVRFDRAQNALTALPGAALPKSGQALEFDGVAEGRSGSMAFDQVDHVR